MSVFEHGAHHDHERVVFASDRDSGLRAIVAIHDSTLGPAGGGLRFYPYASSADALNDVLRLSQAMTWKMALAGLPFGGAKSVIVGDPRTDKTEARLLAYGRLVDSLDGGYICGPDVGTTPQDMAVISRATRSVAGLPETTGDTSPDTGVGVVHAIRAAVRRRLGRDDLAGLRVAVQGVGAVGYHTCKHLAAAGAQLAVADTDKAAVDRVVAEFGAEAVPADAILAYETDVLAPCALGGILNDDTIPAIQAAVVCGGANNQLAEPRHGRALADRGILFVPDYVANAGGAIAATSVFLKRSRAEVDRVVAAIAETCDRLFAVAERDGVDTDTAATRLAQEIVAAKRAGKAAEAA